MKWINVPTETLNWIEVYERAAAEYEDLAREAVHPIMKQLYLDMAERRRKVADRERARVVEPTDGEAPAVLLAAVVNPQDLPDFEPEPEELP